ncbi:MAG: HD domain-containing protein [Brumimicrobium sp.]|nr:HD domain-containing protein [Brumimicrobium sp.]MCO5268352.1 HD domain-containing protein [Brumimicrobium sp.]
MKQIIQSIEAEIKSLFENEGTGHDWYHIDRVRNMALHIQEKEGGDREIVELAALLHDISDHKFNGGDFSKGGIIAKEILEKFHVSSTKILEIVEIVNNVSYKGSGVEDSMHSLEGRIVQDADRMDAVGAIGIARAFAYGGYAQRPIFDPEVLPQNHQSTQEYVENRSHSINHFYEKLLLLKDRMHTNTGRKLAEERSMFLESYLRQFYYEWFGENDTGFWKIK